MKNIAYILTCTLLMLSCKVIDDIKKELLVKIQTNEAIGVYSEGCVLGGNVTDDGGKAVTEYGVCYANSPGPTTSSTKLALGSGSGSFQWPVRGLIANTTYYCRAYCINAYGTSYGNEISFKTPDYSIPTFVGLPTTTSINDNSIGLKGAINFDGVWPSDWGFCYAETSNPTILNNKVKSTDLNGGGATGSIFTAKLSSLKSNTSYYIRAYCTNAKGTGYSDQILVKTTIDPAVTAALTALKSGLQVYYPFNGNANDATSNGFNGTVTGATLTTDRYNMANSAYSFDGKNGTRIKTNYFGVLGGESRTISVWAKQSSALANNSPLVSYGNLNNVWGQGCVVSFGNLNNSPSVFFDNVASAAGVGFNVADNSWHHYVIVYDKAWGTTANAVKVYIDGIYYPNNVFYNPYTINTVKGTSLVIGEYNADIGDFRTFNGVLDDIGVWNRALSATEVQLLFTYQL